MPTNEHTPCDPDLWGPALTAALRRWLDGPHYTLPEEDEPDHLRDEGRDEVMRIRGAVDADSG